MKASRILKITVLLIPLLFISYAFSDNTWLMLSEGAHILSDGLSLGECVLVPSMGICPRFLPSILFALVFRLFSKTGVIALAMLLHAAIVLLMYRFCVASTKNTALAYVCALGFSLFFAASTPATEAYLALFFITLSLFSIQSLLFGKHRFAHAFALFVFSYFILLSDLLLWTMWLMLLFSLLLIEAILYLINKSQQKIMLAVLFCACLLSVIPLFLPPYGTDKLTYITASFARSQLEYWMQVPDIKLSSGKVIYLAVLVFIVLILALRKAVRLSPYHAAFVLTGLFCAFLHTEFFPIYLIFCGASLVSLLPICRIPSVVRSVPSLLSLGLIVFLCFAGVRVAIDAQNADSEVMLSSLKELADATPTAKKQSLRLFIAPEHAGYASYLGFQVYKNNHEGNFPIGTEAAPGTTKEYSDMRHGRSLLSDFIDRYSFDYMFLTEKDFLYTYLDTYHEIKNAEIYVPVQTDGKSILYKKNNF